MSTSLNSLAVFCGSKSGSDPIYIDQAKKLGVYLAENDIHLVYGGARSGLMGAIASSCLSQGGKVTGVMPVSLEKKESIQPGLTELIEVITLSQMGVHKKPSAFLDINGFYTPLINFLVKAADQGFIHPDYLDMLIVSSDIQNLIQQMQTFTHPHTRFNPS